MSSTRPAAVIVLAAGEGTRMKSATPKVLHAIGGRSLLGHAHGRGPRARPRAPRRRRPARARPGRRARRRGRPGGASSPTRTRSRAPAAPSRCGLAALPGRLHRHRAWSPTATCRCSTPSTLRALVDRARRERRPPSPSSPPTSPTRPATAGSCATPTGDVVAHRRAEGRRRRRSARSARSTPASTPSTRARAARRARPRSAPTTRRARCTSPTSLGDRARPTAAGSRRAADRRRLAGRGRQRPGPAGHARRRAQPPRARAAGCAPASPSSTRRPPGSTSTSSSRPTSRCCPAPSCTARPRSPAARRIGPDTTLTDCEVGAGASVVRTHGTGAVIGAGRDASARSPTCGRARCSASDGKIGTFVETKNAAIGAGLEGAAPLLRRRRRRSASGTQHRRRARSSSTTTASHKHRTDDRRPRAGPASDTMFVAPVTIGDGAYTAAGSVVRQDVPPGALAVSAGAAAQHRGLGASGAEPGTAGGRGGRAPRRERAAGTSRATRGEAPGHDRHHDHRREAPRADLRAGATPSSPRRSPSELGIDLVPDGRLRLRQRRDLRAVRGERARLRRLRHPEPHGADQRVDHGAADHGRRAQAGLRQADHRGRAVLRLRPAGQEAPRPRADLGPAGRRPVQDGRRRPADGRRPAHRADPGLLRRPGRPPVRAAAARGARRASGSTAPASPSSRPTPAASGSPTCGPTGSARRWRSSTSAATRACRTR